MDEKEWRECLKIHGYVSSDDEDSDCGTKLTLDEMYEAFKPPPILIDPKKHKIIEIGSCESDANSAFTDSSRKSEKKVQKLTKSQKKRRRKKLRESLGNASTASEADNDNTGLIPNDANREDDSQSNQPFRQDTPKADQVANDAASTSSSSVEHADVAEATNDTNFTRENKSVIGTPVVYVNAYYIQQQFLHTMDSMLQRLRIIIATSPTDTLNICNNVQLCLRTVENFGIIRKSIKCVAILLVDTAARFSTFVNDIQSNSQLAKLKIQEFFNDMNTIILVTVTKHLGLVPEIMDAFENLIFVSFNSVLMMFSEKIVKIVYTMTGVIFGNPYRHVVMCPGTVWEGYYDILHLINLAKNIEQTRMKQPIVQNVTHQIGPFVITVREPHIQEPCEIITTGLSKEPQCQSQLHPLVVDDLTTNQSLSHDSGSNLKNWEDFQNGHVQMTEEIPSCDATTKRESSKALEVSHSQSQLQPLVTEDLTRSRRFWYDVGYSGSNSTHWQDFQNLYLSETIPEKRKTGDGRSKEEFSTALEVSHSPSVVDDLTRNRRFLYEMDYSKPNFQSWRDFLDVYFNEKLSVLQTRSQELYVGECLTEDMKVCSGDDCLSEGDLECLFSVCEKSQNDDTSVGVPVVKELSPVEFPLFWTLTNCDIRILTGSIIFVLFYRHILYCVINFVDVFVLILLLFYLCTYFVIKF